MLSAEEPYTIVGVCLHLCWRRSAFLCCCRRCQPHLQVPLMPLRLPGCLLACCSSQSYAGFWGWTGSVRRRSACWRHVRACLTLLLQVREKSAKPTVNLPK
jgi:hypothetical protein